MTNCLVVQLEVVERYRQHSLQSFGTNRDQLVWSSISTSKPRREPMKCEYSVGPRIVRVRGLVLTVASEVSLVNGVSDIPKLISGTVKYLKASSLGKSSRNSVKLLESSWCPVLKSSSLVTPQTRGGRSFPQ